MKTTTMNYYRYHISTSFTINRRKTYQGFEALLVVSVFKFGNSLPPTNKLEFSDRNYTCACNHVQSLRNLSQSRTRGHTEPIPPDG